MKGKADIKTCYTRNDYVSCKIVRTGSKYGFPEERAPDVRADVSSLPLAPAYLPTQSSCFFLLSLKGSFLRSREKYIHTLCNVHALGKYPVIARVEFALSFGEHNPLWSEQLFSG